MAYRAVIFDLGGVVFGSPFEAFDAYERAEGLPPGSVRHLIAASSERGAWAALERGELTLEEFHDALETEAAAAGHTLDAAAIMARIAEGFGPRPSMVNAARRIRAEGLRTGALTNNWVGIGGPDNPNGFPTLDLFDVFDVVVESSAEGLRKPDPRIYALVCERLGVAPPEAVFLDDLGINLKPAREMGMTTIKVVDPDDALRELEAVLGFPVLG